MTLPSDAKENRPEKTVPNNSAHKKSYQRPTLRTLGTIQALTRGTGATANGDGGQMMMVVSDRTTKEKIVRIDAHPLGFGIYLFDYKSEYQDLCGHGRQFGVMAQEVEAILPGAVSVHPDGYKMVDYAMLGISHRIQKPTDTTS
jgi:hypothetical protein